MRRSLSIGMQVYGMKVVYPTFIYARRSDGKRRLPTWIGTLQPSETSPCYRVAVTYTPPKSPTVEVLSPVLRPDAPHRYDNKWLCLYFPKDASWLPSRHIANTIVPWTAVWLRCYELWCTTGKWFGLEAPHLRRKKR